MEIAIFGAGVGGLTAAHKLATTDIPFRITIYEQKPVAGGLVRSEGPPCRTREVSWRVYFDFYHYLPSIMHQIPDGEGKTVYDPSSNSICNQSQRRRRHKMIGRVLFKDLKTTFVWPLLR